jgi:hypothetical protein
VNVVVVLGLMILMRIEDADYYTRTGSAPEAHRPRVPRLQICLKYSGGG